MSAYVPSYIACNSCISSETVESLLPPLSWSLQWTVVMNVAFQHVGFHIHCHPRFHGKVVLFGISGFAHLSTFSCVKAQKVVLLFAARWPTIQSSPRTAMPFSLHVNVDTCIVVAISDLRLSLCYPPPLHSSKPLDLLLRRLYDAC